MMQSFFSWIQWDPHPDLLVIPGLNHPIRWYGAFFALGFAFGYFIIQKILTRYLVDSGLPLLQAKRDSARLADRLAWMVILGTLIGARLGHVFFYGWDYYSQYPFEIIKVWEGGLASHGGALGVLCAMWFFVLSIRKSFSWLNYLTLLDCIVIPTALVGCCIRIGNFFNQEIVGVPSEMPWAIVFGHPFDEDLIVPRHPAQLYEAVCYFILFSILYSLWNRRFKSLLPGTLSGLFFVLMFTARFLIEFVKVTEDEGLLNTGQWLSIPFIVAGALLLLRVKYKKEIKVGI